MDRREFIAYGGAAIAGAYTTIHYSSFNNPTMAIELNGSGELDVSVENRKGIVQEITISIPDDDSFSLITDNINTDEENVEIEFYIDIENDEDSIEDRLIAEGEFELTGESDEFQTLDELNNALETGEYSFDIGIEFHVLDSLDESEEDIFNVDEPTESKDTDITFRIIVNHPDIDELESEIDFTVTVENLPLIGDWFDLDQVRNYLDVDYTIIDTLNENSDGYDEIASPTANGGTGFEPIGDNTEPFTGSIDGDNNVIQDLFIDRAGRDIGLFGEISNGVVENLNFQNIDITGGSYIGAIAGAVRNGGLVQNCFIEGNLESTDTTDGNSVLGGAVGVTEADFIDVLCDVNITSVGDAVGGLTGATQAGAEVENSGAEGVINGNNGNLVGGLVGTDIDGGSTITECFADVNTTGDNNIGGLIGEVNGGDVINSYSRGDVTGNNNVGGLVGNLGGNFENTSFAATSYSTGFVTGNTNVGGLVGNRYEGPVGIESTVTDSYWDTDTSGQAGSNGGDPRNTFQMTGNDAPANMGGFDFDNIWSVVTNPDDYPILENQGDIPEADYSVSDIITNEPITELEDNIEIEFILENTGELEEEETYTITVEDFGTESELISLAPSETETINIDFETEFGDEGTYDITVDVGDTTETETITIDELETEDPETNIDEDEDITVEGGGGAEVTLDWDVEDADGALDSLEIILIDEDGSILGSESPEVSGDSETGVTSIPYNDTGNPNQRDNPDILEVVLTDEFGNQITEIFPV